MKNLLLASALLPALLNAQQYTAPQHTSFAPVSTAGISERSFDLHTPVRSAAEDSTASQQKLVKIISFSVAGGGEYYRDGYEDRAVFQQLQPNSPIMFADLSGYSNQLGFGSVRSMSFNSNSYASFSVNMRLRGQKNFSELRVGLLHSVVGLAAQDYSQETTTAQGQMQLPNGEMLYTDSVHMSSYSYRWYSDLLSLHAAWYLRSNPGRLFNCYTGLGLSGGIGYNGVVSASRSDYSYKRNYSNGRSHIYYQSDFQSEVQDNEAYKAPAVAQFGAFIPIGANMRLSRRNNFLAHFALFGEYQGGLYLITCPKAETRIRTVSGLNGGIRYYVDAPKGKFRKEGRRHRGQHGEEHRPVD